VTFATTVRRRFAPFATVLVALLLAYSGATAASAQAVPAPTNPSGFLRLGHLAPDVGPVDVYLKRADGGAESVIKTAPYGAFTPYQTLAPDLYTVAMRLASAAPNAAPLFSAPVAVGRGKAYTMLATGTQYALKTALVDDDLTKPPNDASRVRLVQGSTAAPMLTVAAVGGPTLTSELVYGQATGYANVPQGRWTLKVTKADGSEALNSAPVVDLAAGSVNSLLVTDAPGGGIAITPVVDATGLDPAMAPAGGIETGLGGTATDVVNAPAFPMLGDLGAAAVLALILGVVATTRRKAGVTVRQ